MSPNPSVEENYLIPGTTSIVVYTKDYLKIWFFIKIMIQILGSPGFTLFFVVFTMIIFFV